MYKYTRKQNKRLRKKSLKKSRKNKRNTRKQMYKIGGGKKEEAFDTILSRCLSNFLDDRTEPSTLTYTGAPADSSGYSDERYLSSLVSNEIDRNYSDLGLNKEEVKQFIIDTFKKYHTDGTYKRPK